MNCLQPSRRGRELRTDRGCMSSLAMSLLFCVGVSHPSHVTDEREGKISCSVAVLFHKTTVANWPSASNGSAAPELWADPMPRRRFHRCQKTFVASEVNSELEQAGGPNLRKPNTNYDPPSLCSFLLSQSTPPLLC